MRSQTRLTRIAVLLFALLVAVQGLFLNDTIRNRVDAWRTGFAVLGSSPGNPVIQSTVLTIYTAPRSPEPSVVIRKNGLILPQRVSVPVAVVVEANDVLQIENMSGARVLMSLYYRGGALKSPPEGLSLWLLPHSQHTFTGIPFST